MLDTVSNPSFALSNILIGSLDNYFCDNYQWDEETRQYVPMEAGSSTEELFSCTEHEDQIHQRFLKASKRLTKKKHTPAPSPASTVPRPVEEELGLAANIRVTRARAKGKGVAPGEQRKRSRGTEATKDTPPSPTAGKSKKRRGNE